MYGVGFGIGAIGATTKRSSGVAIDTDAQAFFTANSTLTDATTKTAINQFVLDLKSYSLWTLGKYMYLGFLGNSTKCSYNLFSPSSNQLTFSSGWTFDNQGVKGNGTSTYANTSFIPSSSASLNDKSLFIYSQTDIDELSIDIGSRDAFNKDLIYPKYNGIMSTQLSCNTLQSFSLVGRTSKGLVLSSRTASNVTKLYNKASLLGTDTTIPTSNPTRSDFLGSANDGYALYPSNRKISIYGRMRGLDATQVTNLNTCINTLLTSLSIPTW